MFIIFKTELPTCAMFLLPAERKPLWSDTQVDVTKTATTNGSTWWGKKKKKKRIRVLACVLGQYSLSLAKCASHTALLKV